MIPLTMAQARRPYKVLRITGKDEVRRRLQSLGLMENAELIVNSCINGNVVLEVKGTRLAIDSSLARRIMV